MNYSNTSKPSYSRYFYGEVALSHKGRITTTSVGSDYDRLISTLPFEKSKVGKVPILFDNRPDMISDVFYDTPGYWWYIMQANGVTDPFEQLNPGDTITIPVI